MSSSSSENFDEELLKACINQNLESIKELLKKGASFSAVNKSYRSNGWNGLHFISYYGNNLILKEILDNKKSLEFLNTQTSDSYFYGLNGKQTASHIALSNNNIKTYHLLKLSGSNQDLKDSRGYTVHDYPIIQKQEKALKFLGKLNEENNYDTYRDISVGFLSEDVYDIHSHIPPLSWKLLIHVDHKKEDVILNYYGAAYFDEITKTLAIVHRGTKLNANNIQTDIQLFTGILKGEMPIAQYYSCLFSDYVIQLLTGEKQKSAEKLFEILSETSQKYLTSNDISMEECCILHEELIKNYKNNVKEICHSGHSLGGAHSQFCSFFDGHKSITFDNPPNRHMIESVCSKAKYEVDEKEFLMNRLYKNSKCYFGPANYINGFSFYGDEDIKMMKLFAEISHISHDCIFVEKGAHVQVEKNEKVEKSIFEEESNVYLTMLTWIKNVAVFAYNQYTSHSIQRINDKISTMDFWKNYKNL
eukprot:gene6990-11156_t